MPKENKALTKARKLFFGIKKKSKGHVGCMYQLGTYTNALERRLGLCKALDLRLAPRHAFDNYGLKLFPKTIGLLKTVLVL